QVRSIHGAARGGTGTDHGVDLVDEHDRARGRLDLLDHLLEALFEIAAIARARPSAIAVLPTPASPTNKGLFLLRRHSTWMVRLISASRPISGSILPSRA